MWQEEAVACLRMSFAEFRGGKTERGFVEQ